MAESYAKSGCKTHSRTLVPHKGLLCPAGGYSGVRVVKLSPNKEKSGHSNVNCTVQLLKWDSQLGCPVQCQYQAREDHGGPPRLGKLNTLLDQLAKAGCPIQWQCPENPNSGRAMAAVFRCGSSPLEAGIAPAKGVCVCVLFQQCGGRHFHGHL